MAVRAKVKRDGKGFLDFYRVVRPSDGAIGWQAKRPEGFTSTPYVGVAGALGPEHRDEPLFWPEGEKDVDTLQRLGLLAFTFGGASDVPECCAALVAGRRLIVLGDNDEPTYSKNAVQGVSADFGASLDVSGAAAGGNGGFGIYSDNATIIAKSVTFPTSNTGTIGAVGPSGRVDAVGAAVNGTESPAINGAGGLTANGGAYIRA